MKTSNSGSRPYSAGLELLAINQILAERAKTTGRARVKPTAPEKAFDPRTLFGDPVSPRQALFLNLTCEEALYGGAAGGGKSSGLLMAALQYVHVPRYSALLMRRTYTDLSMPGALMHRAHLWLDPSVAKWNQNEKLWTFPSGATLKFGFCEHERDVEQYKSAEFQYIGIDEASEFSETQTTYMFSRLRRPRGFPVPLRLRLGSNPCPWLRQRFMIPSGFHGDVHWAIEDRRAFVPATLWDNPGLDTEEYYQKLGNLPLVLRQQLREGDWDIRPTGKLFRREWFRVQSAAPAAGRVVRAWDLAATAEGGDWTRGVRMRHAEGRFYVERVAGGRWSPKERDEAIVTTAAADGRAVEIVIEEEPGSGGKAQVLALIDKLAGYRVKGLRSTGSKIVRAGPLASQAEAGNVILIEGPWIEEYVNELEAFPTEGVPDDQVDGSSGAFLTLTEPRERPGALPVGFGVKGWQPAGVRRR